MSDGKERIEFQACGRKYSTNTAGDIFDCDVKIDKPSKFTLSLADMARKKHLVQKHKPDVPEEESAEVIDLTDR